MLCKGFPPIVAEKPIVLVLGSMPGVKSLVEQQYYANQQNAFWLIISEYFNFDINLGYSKKLQHLKNNRIALWDVIEECERQGSLDSSINQKSITANDFSKLLLNHASITSIIFNGVMAERMFNKYVIKSNLLQDDIVNRLSFYRLPSTSPANASIKKTEKIKQWKNALDLCLN